MLASAYHQTSFNQGPLREAHMVTHPPQIKGAKLLVLWGGEDISPALYHQEPVHAHAGKVPSHRDKVEWNLLHAAVKEGIPILGICRGAQMLCAAGGGALYQHVENHGTQHILHTTDGKEFMANSCHHQMMIPTEDMQVLAVTPCRSPKKWMDQSDPIISTEDEPEVVYFPKMKAIGVQGHPEWMSYESVFVKWIRQIIGELLHVEI